MCIWTYEWTFHILKHLLTQSKQRIEFTLTWEINLLTSWNIKLYIYKDLTSQKSSQSNVKRSNDFMPPSLIYKMINKVYINMEISFKTHIMDVYMIWLLSWNCWFIFFIFFVAFKLSNFVYWSSDIVFLLIIKSVAKIRNWTF